MPKPIAILILLFFSISCSTIKSPENYSLKKEQVINYYSDKLVKVIIPDYSKIEFDEIRKRVEEKIDSSLTGNPDVILFGTNAVNWISVESKNILFIWSVNIASEIANKRGVKFILLIDFADYYSLGISSNKDDLIKKNISDLVKNCRLDGLYFNNNDFSQAFQKVLFEEVIIECMLLKPHLIICGNKTNYAAGITDVYLSSGLIDFLIDEQKNYSIIISPQLSSIAENKVLKNYLKRISPEHFYRLDLSTLADKNSTALLLNENRTIKISSDKKISFWLKEKTDTIKLQLGENGFLIPKTDWVIPYNYKLNPDLSASRYGAWVEFRRPFQQKVESGALSLLCRTSYPSEVFINDEQVKIYKTGVFFKKINLTEGLNKIRAEIKTDYGETAFYETQILFSKKIDPFDSNELVIDEKSLLPNENLILQSDEYLYSSFIGTKLQKGFVEIFPGNYSFECKRKDFSNYSQYEFEFPLNNFAKNQKYNLNFVLKSRDEALTKEQIVNKSEYTFTVKDFNDFPYLETKQNNSLFTYTLAPIRLGAPLRNELPKGVIIKSNGKFGDFYRVHLNDTEEGYISSEYVNELPSSTIKPTYFLNPITCYPDETADIVKIPYLQNVPFDIFPEPEQKRIVITLYGVKTSSTWIIHRTEPKYISEITWQQASKETYKIFVNLKTSKIWGYEIKPNNRELVFKIKYPPDYDIENSLPLKGIKISIEAGHGGSNSGAVGLSGLKEKDINLKLSLMLEDLFRKNGAEVLQVRDNDRDMSLVEKRDIVTNSDANVHLSIHANASEPPTEYLGASGTCTFYNNPFWAPFSENVYKRLIELDLKPFGSVGSFNYRVTRMSEMPAILVEQAFMSHAEDEEKLADDNFRKQMAEKILIGLIDYLKYMKE